MGMGSLKYYRTADIVKALNKDDYIRFTSIKMILDKWDLLGLQSYIPYPAQLNEYDREALYVLRVLKRNGSVDDVAKIFLRCFHTSDELSSMDESRRKGIENKYNEIAKILYEL